MMITDFVSYIRNNRSANTARTYAQGAKLLEGYVDGRELTPRLLVGFPAWLNEKGYAQKSIGVYLAMLAAFCEWLEMGEKMEFSHADMTRIKVAQRNAMRTRKVSLPRHADPKDVEAVRKSACSALASSPQRERDVAMIEFLYSTGCRINEACALTVDKVNMETGSALVVGKGSKERWVYMSKEAVGAIKAYLATRYNVAETEPLFCRHDSGASNNVLPLQTLGARGAIQKIAIAAGVKGFHPHLFRHHFGTKMINATGDLALVQDLMGHASPASTRIYAKVDSDRMRTACANVWNG